jgi:hypothetical protein
MVHSSRRTRALPKRRSFTATTGTASLRCPTRAKAVAGMSWPVGECIFRVGGLAPGVESGEGDLRFSGF